MPSAVVHTAAQSVRVEPSRTAAPEVSVCIASWNCVALLRKCLLSLFGNSQGIGFEVVVADNASTDGAAEMVAKEFPQVLLIRNSTNRGFAVASNQAAARSRGRFLFFLNNDTEVPAHTLRRLLDHAQANPKVGMFGPRLRESSGNVQISYRRRPTLPALLHKLSVIRWTGLFRKAHADYRRGSFNPEGVRQVEVLMGSAVFVSRDVFEEVGRWDERYRFGVEDIDLSTQVSLTRPVVYAGDVEVVHHGRASSRENVGYVAPSVTTGYVQYFRKSGVGSWVLFWYKLAVTLNAPIQLIEKAFEAAARRLAGQRKDAGRSWATVRGVWAFLRHELVRFWRA
ncbi:MAG: glycosyltransferase family 2 protein [Planctomycetes bacterium]|nr:glycosyltransferase family 2 protein [Planctomycetota bacterium]